MRTRPKRRLRRFSRRQSDSAMAMIVPILRSGVLAEALCRSAAGANLEVVFERSLYLRCGDEFICIGEPDIGNGPLTLTGSIGWRPFALQPGQPVAVCDRHITIGDAVRFTLNKSESWRAPPWPASPSAVRLIETCTALERRVTVDAPEEGLARIVLKSSPAKWAPLARIARPRTAMFESWLSGLLDGHAPVMAGHEPVQGLIGLGPGLTPSGDDFLVGALALLAAIGARHAHAALAGAIKQALPGATAPLSACFLRAAAAGHVGENLHRAVSALMSGEVDAVVGTIANIGHSSGWDMMAGIAIALRVAATGHALAPS
jgi:Protein of unknown function (DUF2877)